MIVIFSLAVPFLGLLAVMAGVLLGLLTILYPSLFNPKTYPPPCLECWECGTQLSEHTRVDVIIQKILVLLGLALASAYIYSGHCQPILRVSDNPLLQRIIKKGKSLKRGFWPTMWASSGHDQSCLFGLFPGWKLVLGVEREVTFERELITVTDGGTIALDWAHMEGENQDKKKVGKRWKQQEEKLKQYFFEDKNVSLNESSPVLILTCGVVGKSNNAYLRHLISDIRNKYGWRCVVKSWRGFGDVPLTGEASRPETWDPVFSVDDLLCSVRHVHSKYPSAPLLGCGYSIGAWVWATGVGLRPEEFTEAGMRGMVCLSGPNNYELTMSRIQHLKPLPYDWVNMGVVWKTLKKYVSPSESYEGVKESPWLKTVGLENLQDLLGMMKFRTSARSLFNRFTPITGWLWHQAITLKFTGHESVESYTRDVNQSALTALSSLPVPTLLLYADDDPIVPPQAQWEFWGAALKSKNAVVVQCNAGGHCGFFEGVLLSESWQNKVVIEFFEALLEEKKELSIRKIVEKEEKIGRNEAKKEKIFSSSLSTSAE